MSGDVVTVLTAKGHRRASKIIRWREDLGFPEILPYDGMKTFRAVEEPVSGIDGFAALLDRLERDPSAFIVRGRLADGVDRNRMQRLARTGIEPATLEPAAHHWIPLDVDTLPCPDLLDSVHEPVQTVEYVVSQLPEEFHGATCRWQFTSSQGIKPGICLRLFFWADRSLSDGELKAWLGERVPTAGQPRNKWPRRWPVDPAIFKPAQPIYTAGPIIVGMPDPVPVRSGLWRGDRDEITSPTIGPTRSYDAIASVPGSTGGRVVRLPEAREPGVGYEAYRAAIGDHEGGGFFAPIKSAVACWIATHGAGADTQWLRADVERAIREASRDPAKHPDDYVEIRVADLETLIPAILELQRASETLRQQPGECEPTYPAPFGTVEEARGQLTRALDGHVRSIAAYAATRAAYLAELQRWQKRQEIAA